MKQLHTRRGMLFFLCFCFSHLLQAQTTERRLKEDKTVSRYSMNPALKTPSFISFRPDATVPGSNAKAVIQKLYSLGREHTLELMGTTELRNGVKVEKYKEYFKGIRIEHSAYNVVSRNGAIQSIYAESYPLGEGFTVSPSLTTDNARTKAIGFVHAEKYAWDAIEEDKHLFPGNLRMQQRLEGLKQAYQPKGELVIAKDLFGTKGARLAYKFDVFAVQPVSRYLVYVDALTGKVLISDAVIKHANKLRRDPKPDSLYYLPNYQYYGLATDKDLDRFPPRGMASVMGTALTRYSGTREIYTTKLVVPLLGTQDPNNPDLPLTYSGVDPRQTFPVLNDTVYILKDDTRGGGIETYDLNAVGGAPVSLPTLYEQALAFVDRDNNWKDEADQGLVTREDLIRGNPARDGSNGATEATNDDMAIDAHWGAEIVYDYWKQVHNRQSYDNKNSAIRSYVHYGPAYDNAFWNGSVMTYGDGSGTVNPTGGFKPLTSLDVCGHEIGHGVCTFTADLVYQGESGAMNEGLSDIWAACIERFAKTRIDPTLNYQYFQVGEQIAPDGEGLRRQDNPKRYSNPDTYGGQYWSNPDCGVPNLANDECGVHNNSGVLNKWFYLLVQGPKTTTGSPAYTDDGVADKPRTVPSGSAFTSDFVADAGNNYGALAEFLGLGFDKAEQITYLMELSLTPNATFANAREASINAAQVLYGACSQEEISTTDAWYGVGVGSKWNGCTAPPLAIDVLSSTITEGSGDCGSYTDYPIGITLTQVQGSSTTVNITVEPTTTAEPHDYMLSTTSLNYNAGEFGKKPLVLRVYNDDIVEGDETIVLHVASALKDTIITLTIKDDDVQPVIGGEFTLLNENFEEVADNRLPAGWTRVNKTNPSGGEWNVRTGTGVSTGLTFLTKRAYIFPIVGNAIIDSAARSQAAYNPTVASQVILRTPMIDARGYDSLRLSFRWSAGGEGACDPACDYGEVVYSLDGVNFQRFSQDSTGAGDPSVPLYLSPADSTYNNILGQIVTNKQFYLGFRWTNDDLATTSPGSITIDDIVLTGIGRKIESDSTSGVTTRVPVEPGKPVYFYSREDKGLLSQIINASADLGCVNDTLVQTGAGTAPYKNTRRTRKVYQITPTQNSSATYTLTLYYTTQELAGFNVPPQQLQMVKTNAADIDQGNNTNTVIVTPTLIDSSKQGFYGFRATFNGFSKFFIVEPLTAPLPVACLDFKAVKGTGDVGLTWRVASEVPGTRYVIERSTDGATFTSIGTIMSNSSGQYNFADQNLAGLSSAYYRLKEVGANGATHYLCSVLYVPVDGRRLLSIGNVFPNPGRGEATVNITSSESRRLRIEYVNAAGQVVGLQNEQLQAGASGIALHVRSLASGSYLVRFKDEGGKVLKTQQFIKQ